MYLRYLVKMKQHISYLYNALYSLQRAEWQTRWHNPPDWGLVSSVTACLALWSVIQQYVYETRVHDIDEVRQHLTACVARLAAVADWWRSWPMANVLACFCSCQWRTFWTYFVTIKLFSLYLMNFMFHIMLDAACNILRMHYKSMKCDVSFSLGSVTS